MKRYFFPKMICCLLVLITSCVPDYAHIFEENNKKFDKNRALLNNTLFLIEKNYLKNWDSKFGLTLELEDFHGQLKENLLELGIGKVEISGIIGCDEKNYSVAFHVTEGWNIETLRVVQLIYEPCNFNTKRDQKKHSSYRAHQDFWGQGGDWFIYSDTDKF